MRKNFREGKFRAEKFSSAIEAIVKNLQIFDKLRHPAPGGLERRFFCPSPIWWGARTVKGQIESFFAKKICSKNLVISLSFLSAS